MRENALRCRGGEWRWVGQLQDHCKQSLRRTISGSESYSMLLHSNQALARSKTNQFESFYCCCQGIPTALLDTALYVCDAPFFKNKAFKHFHLVGIVFLPRKNEQSEFIYYKARWSIFGMTWIFIFFPIQRMELNKKKKKRQRAGSKLKIKD